MVTVTDVTQRVAVIGRLHNVTINLDWTSGRARVSNSQGRDISPRLPRRDMMMWLEGFEAGLEASK